MIFEKKIELAGQEYSLRFLAQYLFDLAPKEKYQTVSNC